jgi:hypothetical protein
MGRELRVVRIADGEVVKRIAISPDKSEHLVEKTMMGLLRNMSDDYRVEDSADDVARLEGKRGAVEGGE